MKNYNESVKKMCQCATELNKRSMTTLWQSLFICQRSIRIKVPIVYQWKREIRNLRNNKSNNIYWL